MLTYRLALMLILSKPNDNFLAGGIFFTFLAVPPYMPKRSFFVAKACSDKKKEKNGKFLPGFELVTTRFSAHGSLLEEGNVGNYSDLV